MGGSRLGFAVSFERGSGSAVRGAESGVEQLKDLIGNRRREILKQWSSWACLFVTHRSGGSKTTVGQIGCMPVAHVLRLRRGRVQSSYSKVHTCCMASVRRTISLPPNLADQLDKEAERRGMTFSALIADLAGAKTTRLPYAGIISEDEDLSLRVEEVLSRLAS